MPSQRRRAPERLVSALAIVIALGAAPGCHPPTAGPESPEALGPPLAARAVDDPAFAATIHQLLREGTPTRERSALLAGAVERQLAHAALLFEQKKDVRGTRAVVGALYLLRVGETRPDMFGPGSLAALRGAVERFSARGDEGRAMALMIMQAGLLPAAAPERAELERHLAALEKWSRETRTGGDMQRLAAAERAAIGRAVLDPDEASLAAAAAAIGAWIERAIDYNLAYQQTRKLPPRDEIAEAYKALEAGAETMAAIYLRYGRAKDALVAIEASAARGVTNPSFFTRLRAAAIDDTAEDWRLLARDFARIAFAEGEPMIDQALVEAALWGIAVEAYRRDPTSHAVGHLLADLLLSLEMPEVAPLVLRDALGPKPPVAVLSAALSKVAEALVAQLASSDPGGSRRIFAASQWLLEMADEAPFKGQVEPSSASLRQLMAGIELQSGNVAGARPLLESALAGEPSVRGYVLLASLERQIGQREAALSHLRRVAELPAARSNRLDAAEAKLLEHEILRDSGAGDRASTALDEALGLVIAARQGADAAGTVRAERTLARVLDGYGERARAAHALERALHLAEEHRAVLPETMLAAVSRALVYGNIDAARSALQLGIKAGLEREPLVYAALWLMFLERQLEERPDGKVDRVLLEASDGSGWPASLARWGRGAITDAELEAAAASYTEKTEATFYLAMRRRVAGQPAPELASVAESPLVELVEVQIARDLLAPRIARELPPKYESALSARD